MYIKQTIKKSYILLFSLLMGIVIVTDQGLWIDEGVTALFASQTSFFDLFKMISESKATEAISFGYEVYIWLWVKAFGFTEYVLRLSNIPYIFCLFFVVDLLKNKNLKLFLYVFILLNPMIWYYVNDARAYISLFTFSFISLLCLFQYFECDNIDRQIFLRISVYSIIVGCFFNVLQFFYFPPFFVALILLLKHNNSSLTNFYKKNRILLLTSCCILVFPLAYYMVAVMDGSGGIRGMPTIKNIIYVFYDFAGYAGLGPPRNFLREEIRSLFKVRYIVPISLLGLIQMLVFICCLKNKKEMPFQVKILNISIISGILFYFIIALILKSRLLSRHLIFIYGFVIFDLAYAFMCILKIYIKDLWIKGLFILFYCGWIISCINIRFNPLYQKDDYKLSVFKAVEIAGDENDIYWCGSPVAASYYGLRFDSLKVPNKWNSIKKAEFVSNFNEEQQERMFIERDKDIILVLSNKRDIYDPCNIWGKYVDTHSLVPVASTKDFNFYRIFR